MTVVAYICWDIVHRHHVAGCISTSSLSCAVSILCVFVILCNIKLLYTPSARLLCTVTTDCPQLTNTKWPHLSLLARLYAGVDNTSCEVESTYSTLSLTVDALRCSLSEKKIEQMMYLRLNSEFIKEVKEQSEMKKQMAENLANSRRAVRQRLEENKIRVESFSPVDVVDIS